MNEILGKVIFGNYTMQDALFFGGGAAVLLIIIMKLKSIFMKKETTQHFQFEDCTNCDWHGKVSTFAGRCPKCNQPLGDRKAQRRG